ncbi:MAG: DMT family transporter, partial [Oscillospiraceae bacterium]
MNKGMGYAALCALIFVTLEPVSKLLGGQLDPMLVTGVRFAIGGLVLLPGALKKSRKIGLRLGGRDLAQLGLLGVLVICVSMVLLQIAIELSDAPAMIAIIFSSNSVMLLLLAALVLRERLSARRWAAVGLCAAGVLCGTQLSAGAGTASVLLAAAAAATFSLYALLSKKLAARIPSAVQMSLSYLIGSAVLLLWLCGTNLGAFSEIE